MNTTQQDQNTQTENSAPRKSLRGFAAMSPEKQREIARKGGKAAHERGTAHEFTPDEARVAGRKGGEVVSRNRDHMAAIGREGGKSHRRSRAEGREGHEHKLGHPGRVFRSRVARRGQVCSLQGG